MRVLRVQYQNHTFYASLHGDELMCLNKNLGLTRPIPLREVAVVPPVMPTKIICAAVNYKGRADEMQRSVPSEPVLFLKPPSSVIGTGMPIILPSASTRVDYEAELAVIMGKACRNLEPDEAPGHVFGYACANDVTARDLQRQDGQYCRAKGFDSFCPIGPWIETQVLDVSALSISTRVNGEIVQQGNTRDMVFPPFDLVSRISKVMTLQPGDVILTGTPQGVGPMGHGDEVRVEIEGVGILINRAIAEKVSESEESAPMQ